MGPFFLESFLDIQEIPLLYAEYTRIRYGATEIAAEHLALIIFALEQYFFADCPPDVERVSFFGRYLVAIAWIIPLRVVEAQLAEEYHINVLLVEAFGVQSLALIKIYD